MVRSYIGSTFSCRVVFKLENFSHLLCRFVGLGSPIRLGYQSGIKFQCRDSLVTQTMDPSLCLLKLLTT